MIKTIRDNIMTRIGTVLGSTYSKLSFSQDVSANKFKQSNKRFSVNVKGSNAISGAVNSNTYDHSFEIVITDTYQKGQVLNDDYLHDVICGLQDKAMLIYKDLQTNKSYLNAKCLIVNSFSMSEPELLEEEKIIVIKFNVNIKYTN